MLVSDLGCWLIFSRIPEEIPGPHSNGSPTHCHHAAMLLWIVASKHRCHPSPFNTIPPRSHFRLVTHMFPVYRERRYPNIQSCILWPKATPFVICKLLVCVHMGTCAYIVYMYVCLEWYACPCGGQRATPGIIPQSLPTMCFEDRVSHWPGICQGGDTSPRDPPGSVSPVLSLQTYTTMPRCFCFVLLFPVG